MADGEIPFRENHRKNVYAMVGNVPHAIAYSICHVVCKGIPHDHGCDMPFGSCGMFLQNHRKVPYRIFEWHKKLKQKVCGVWGHTTLVWNPATPHFGLMWHCSAPKLWSMTSHTTQSFGFLLTTDILLIIETRLSG